MVTVDVPELPRETVMLLGDAESVKFGGATEFTVRLTVVV
jgi:hypothetical protein